MIPSSGKNVILVICNFPYSVLSTGIFFGGVKMGATEKAVIMMCVALPTMFVVIGLFVGLTKALHKSFPAEED